MKRFLLDVNVLVALEHSCSPHNQRVHTWITQNPGIVIMTCAITELGFLRVSMQAFKYTRQEATAALERIRAQSHGFIKLAPEPNMADWVRTGAQTTDAYLIQLARANKAVLATFDEGLPNEGVEVIR